ncbi:hypothetical protein C8R43DRAFT_952837 [Mycena crocata]|nr:hypothetical protein C8R43DRAFT_952837 [Mycena crocata]
MSSSAIPHVTKFLTRPLSAGFAPAAVRSAQRILNVLLTPEATFTLTSTTTPPSCLRAASLGSSIPWSCWFAALAGGRDVVLCYSPGSLKIRIADGPMDAVWSAEPDDELIPLSHFLKSTSVSIPQQPTSARLQATLLSARVRRITRVQQRLQTDLVRMQVRLLLTPPADPSDDDSGSDYSSDSSDCGSSSSSASSRFTSYSTDSQTSAASSQPAKDLCPSAEDVDTDESACLALPSTRHNNSSRPRGRRPVRLIRVDRAKKHTATYLYEGGVSRVMTGGVMLGPHPAAHVVRATRS